MMRKRKTSFYWFLSISLWISHLNRNMHLSQKVLVLEGTYLCPGTWSRQAPGDGECRRAGNHGTSALPHPRWQREWNYKRFPKTQASLFSCSLVSSQANFWRFSILPLVSSPSSHTVPFALRALQVKFLESQCPFQTSYLHMDPL